MPGHVRTSKDTQANKVCSLGINNWGISLETEVIEWIHLQFIKIHDSTQPQAVGDEHRLHFAFSALGTCRM